MGRIVGLIGTGLIGSLWLCSVAQAASNPIRRAIACPDRLEDLMPLLLRDLPSYANRVNQRAYLTPPAARRENDPDTPGYVLLAGQPDYQALPLNSNRLLNESSSGEPSLSEPPQIFFTTLERQYASGEAVKLQHYHWLFLTQTQSYSWQLVLMFSAIGDYPTQQQPTQHLTSAPQDASQGVIAQAIRLWLTDCRAGAVEGDL
ncbi:MAG: hypothetical protein KME15_05475 [Drouetiella hepatica Uher 2000/2452]|uniref:Uncharacterized protein n=1 Tax=Drouetiella hepatica Uher 2000/2452 TaxID=904376 RepID=A0A951ULH8_9CYAN|nr:hypothetical protein [Drouetiella hepatica Uher 2000/2452]